MKKHNSDPECKIELRRLVVDAMGGIDQCHVLETHAGPGLMRDAAWSGAADIYGIDTDPYSVSEAIGDSCRFLAVADLSRFNVFDVGPFGDYREHLWLISRRVPIDRPIAILCTDGISGGSAGMHSTMVRHGTSAQALHALGFRGHDSPGSIIGRKGAEWQFGRLIEVWFPGCKARKWHAMNRAGHMHYHAAMLTPGEM